MRVRFVLGLHRSLELSTYTFRFDDLVRGVLVERVPIQVGTANTDRVVWLRRVGLFGGSWCDVCGVVVFSAITDVT